MELWLWDLYMEVLVDKGNLKDVSMMNPHLYNTDRRHRTMVITKKDLEKGIPIQDFFDKLKNEI